MKISTEIRSLSRFVGEECGITKIDTGGLAMSYTVARQHIGLTRFSSHSCL